MTFHAVLALAVFVVTYALILSNRVERSIAALLGGMAMILLHVVSETQAFASVDLTVVFLLVGMMILSDSLAKSGFFGYVAIRVAQFAKGRPVPVLVLLCLATGVVSALIDNVTTVLLIAPVTFLIAERLEVNPIPFLVFEVMAANIGGTATLIGDPPNIIIGSRAGLSFNDFLFNVGPPAVLCLLFLCMGAVFFLWRRRRVGRDIRARVMDMNAARAITNQRLLVQSGSVLGLVLLGFVLQEVIGVGPGPIALGGAAVLLVISRADPSEVFKAVEWPTLFFFVGLFITVSGLAASGIIENLAAFALSLVGGNVLAAAMLILWFSGLTGSFIGAIPTVTALIPLVERVIPAIDGGLGAQPGGGHVLWWALSLGACLGGNGTMFGTAANIVIVGIARSNKRPISFSYFMSIGLPVTLATLAVSAGYVIFRYIL